MIAVKANEIMPVALMISEEKVFAMHTSIISPPPLCSFYGFAFWMVVAIKTNAMLS